MELKDVVNKSIQRAKEYVAEKHLLPGKRQIHSSVRG